MVLLAVMFLPGLLRSEGGEPIDYSALIAEVQSGTVSSIKVTNGTGAITGEYTDGTRFSSEGPVELPETDLELLRAQEVSIEFHTDRPNLLVSLLPFLLPFGLIFLLFWWMQRRAQGQMSGIMSIGRSKAKTYTTERPSTKFDDIAGYDGVKQEITESSTSCGLPNASRRSARRSPRGCCWWARRAPARRSLQGRSREKPVCPSCR